MHLPNGYVLVTYRERPDLESAIADHNVGIWQPFMLEDEVANRHFGTAFERWPEFQMILLDAAGAIVAVANSMPLWWDGTDARLPDGWDQQVLRSAADIVAGRAPNTLGAMLIVVTPGLRGSGIAGTMLEAFRAAARNAGYGAVIACVRPTEKERYPLTPIERYATWTRPDGLPFDPWIRLHVRLGGRIVRAAPHSMTIRGTVAEWEEWTGLSFPDSGEYVLPTATSPMTMDRDRDEGVYFDQNVWVVHDLG
ncbi:MAG: GNAT family N-acetyltransferase [Chloroflexi bacterium]|nr:GNAT family N-acetyltransferase [Chloroflexota bacterium]